MEKKEIFEMVIQEMTENALNIRRESCNDAEKKLYHDIGELSKQKEEIIEKLPSKDGQVLKDYILKTNLVAVQECEFLYIQGGKDCIEVLKKLGVL